MFFLGIVEKHEKLTYCFEINIKIYLFEPHSCFCIDRNVRNVNNILTAASLAKYRKFRDFTTSGKSTKSKHPRIVNPLRYKQICMLLKKIFTILKMSGPMYAVLIGGHLEYGGNRDGQRLFLILGYLKIFHAQFHACIIK